MERQEIIHTLRQYRKLHAECQRLRQRIVKRRDSMYDIQAVVTSSANVRSGEIADRVERVVESLDSMADYYTRRLLEAEEAERRIVELIDLIDDNDEHAVLMLHYIDGKSFADISELIYLSERTVFYRHKSAISRLCACADGVIPE